MTDPSVEREATAAQENLPNTLKLAREAEELARTWLQQLETRPPTNEAERQHYRNKAAEFRRFYAARLGDTAKATGMVGDLIAQLRPQADEDQVIILRKQIGSVLEGEAATTRALASVLEVCVAIDRVT